MKSFQINCNVKLNHNTESNIISNAEIESARAKDMSNIYTVIDKLVVHMKQNHN